MILSNSISQTLGASAYLKLENLHPCHSFKYRGISLFAQRAKEVYGPSVHLVIASGGNAGLAAACAAKLLEIRCSVYLPEGATQKTLEILQREQADVIVTGRFYAEALKAAREVVEQGYGAVMVPAYDDEILWEGHSSMIKEISKQLSNKPDVIFCSVGGGGLLGGIIVGCKHVGWDDVPIIALETIGSDCFFHSMSLNNGRFNSISPRLPSGVGIVHDKENDVKLAHFNEFSSKASGSLGASQPSAKVVKMALGRQGNVVCVSIPDELSMQSLVSFIDVHRMLVELACSTALAPAFKPALFDSLVPRKDSGEKRTVVFIVCGGFKISLDDVAKFQEMLDEDLRDNRVGWEVLCGDGRKINVNK